MRLNHIYNKETEMITEPLKTLLANGPILFDGAMGTMLQNAGLTDGGAPELWNVEKPEVLKKIHQEYIDAGARIIETNTFGGTMARLKFHNIGDRVAELNRAGASIAKEVAAPAGALVAGSVGPTGELIEPVGPLSMEEATAMFAEQAAALAEGGADIFLIETMSHLNEVEAAVHGAQKVAPHVPIFVSMSFDTNYHTMMGVSPSEAATLLTEMGVSVVGSNCGTGPDEADLIMGEMARARPDGAALMVYCNAGLPQYVNGAIEYDGTPERMAKYAISMRNMGVDIIGGCCGSEPKHIKAMADALASVKDTPIPGPPAVETLAENVESADSRAARSAERRNARRKRA